MPPSVAQLIGAPELDPTPAPAPTPPAAAALQGDPAVWTVLGEAGGDPQGQLAVGSTLYNRQKALGAQSFGEVATDPANGYEAWQDPATRASLMRRYPVGSSAYQQAQQTLSDLQAGKVAPLPYDSFYSPKAQAALGRPAPAWADDTGTNIGGNLFYGGKFTPPAGTNPVANMLLKPEERAAFAAPPSATPAPPSPSNNPYTTKAPLPAGLTPDMQGKWDAEQPPAATTPDGQRPGGTVLTIGADKVPATVAQERYYAKLAASPKGVDMSPWAAGTAGQPIPLVPGHAVPQGAGTHYIDYDGNEHVVPGGVAGQIGGALSGFWQGTGADLSASVNRLTGGGMAVPSDPNFPMGNAFADLNAAQTGGPNSRDIANAALEGSRQQQNDYALTHVGDNFAKGGRFVGQAVPATAAVAAVPEIEAPAALGAAGRFGATTLTNALRGTAAAATNVGANPNQSVGSQLVGGALAGVALPAATGAVGRTASALTGLGRTVSPEVAQLADLAQTKYGINLASGQVMGAGGDRGAATGYSQMLGSDAKVAAGNAAQRQQWMKGVTSIYGDPSGDVSPDALAGNRSTIGAGMNAITSRTNIPPPVADQVQTRIGQVLNDAQDTLGDDAGPLMNMAAKIGSVRNTNGISGESYQALTNQGSSLDLLQSKHPNPLVQSYAGQIRDALDDGMQASAAPGDADAFQDLRWKYKNLMTVAKAAQNQNSVGTDGVFTPNALNAATTSTFKGRAFQGAGDLDELNAIRKAFMTEPPNSFTSNRLGNLLAPFKVGAEVGTATGLGGAFLHSPGTALAAAGSALAGYAGKAGYTALRNNALGGDASNIIGRSLPNAPGSALAGLGLAKKTVEIPLSALVAQRNVSALTPNTAPVGANAQ